MTKIKCKDCGKEIEKKGNRDRCIKCSNKRDHERSKKYREEYRQIRGNKISSKEKEAGL